MKEKSITMSYLAWRNITRRPFRTICLILMIMLFSATLFGGTVLLKNLNLGISGVGDRLGADIVIVPHGHQQDLEIALLRGEPSTFYLNSELVEQIRNTPGIGAVSPQLFIASLTASCCSEKLQLIGFEQESDFVIKPWVKDKLGQELNDDEVIVGSKITAKVGDEIMFFHRPFKIVAKMDSTGMGFDTSAFMTMKAAQTLVEEEALFADRKLDNTDNYVSSIFIKTARYYQPKDVVTKMMSKIVADKNIDVIIAKDMITNIAKSLNSFSIIVYSLSVILWLLVMISISIIFSSTINERKREISLLRMLGTSRKMLVSMLLKESLIISALAGFIGIVLTGAALYGFSLFICQSIGLPCVNISLIDTIIYALIAFALTLVIGPISSIYSALLMTKLDAYSTFREAE